MYYIMNAKEKFKEEYLMWIKSAAKDIAFGLNQLKQDEVKRIISLNEQYLRDPTSLYGRDGLEAVKELVPKNILLLSTDAVVFSQSIFSPLPSVFDYAVALSRRYYLGLWYSILTFNKTYLKEATEIMIRYTVEHELLQKKAYEETMRQKLRKFTPEEKRKISIDTLREAIKKTGITQEELERENQIMLKISSFSPLIPKPFAEAALYWYLEKNLENLRHLGEASRTEKEEEFGKKLNSDFKEWIDFSMHVYRVFLSEVKKELDYMSHGYV